MSKEEKSNDWELTVLNLSEPDRAFFDSLDEPGQAAFRFVCGQLAESVKLRGKNLKDVALSPCPHAVEYERAQLIANAIAKTLVERGIPENDALALGRLSPSTRERLLLDGQSI